MNVKFLTIAFIVAISSCQNNSEINFSKLQGKWINTSNDYMEIRDSITNGNYIGNRVGTIGKYFQIFGDTLSFQDRYTSSEDNYSTKRVDRYNFKINALTDTTISISPITELGNELFKKDSILLVRQEYAIDKSIEFEKIIFHTTYCYGHCPIYHLEVNKDGKTKLYKEKVYKKSNRNSYSVDSINMGHYSGSIPKPNLKKLEHHIQTCNLDNLEFDGQLCCDGSIVTLIIEYNGKRKYLKDMFPPRIAGNLIDHLYRICEEADLTKTNDTFEFEK